MMVVMQQGATDEQVEAVIERLDEMGFTVHRSTGVVHTVLGGVGPMDDFEPADFEVMPGVKECHRIVSPYKLASRHFKPQGAVIEFPGGFAIGGPAVAVIAGPCNVESEDQMNRAAAIVAASGARVLSAMAFKTRSSPYGFQGLGEAGLKLLRAAADRHGLLVMSEVMDRADIPLVSSYADILRVGARNMRNFSLLSGLGAIRKPVLLRRGPSATVEELLLSAEHILAGGNYDVILCERGIRTFETATRNTLDLSAIPVLRALTHLPIAADPCEATGRRDKAGPMALAAVAAGADAVLIEVHPDPNRAITDGAQSLFPEQFAALAVQIRAVAAAVGRSA